MPKSTMLAKPKGNSKRADKGRLHGDANGEGQDHCQTEDGA